jgi:hypothetical protein
MLLKLDEKGTDVQGEEDGAQRISLANALAG